MEFNKDMSRKYGMKIYDSSNPQFPYYVEGFDNSDGYECFTEDEIKQLVEHHKSGECGDKCMWANEIIGWFESVKAEPKRWSDEVLEIVDELNWFLETMYDTDNLPDWVRDYVNELDESFMCDAYVYVNIIDKVIDKL